MIRGRGGKNEISRPPRTVAPHRLSFLLRVTWEQLNLRQVFPAPQSHRKEEVCSGGGGGERLRPRVISSCGTLEIDGRVRPRESEIWWNKGEKKKKKKIIWSLKERERVGSGTRPFMVVLMIPKIVPEKGINSSVSYRSSLWMVHSFYTTADCIFPISFWPILPPTCSFHLSSEGHLI